MAYHKCGSSIRSQGVKNTLGSTGKYWKESACKEYVQCNGYSYAYLILEMILSK